MNCKSSDDWGILAELQYRRSSALANFSFKTASLEKLASGLRIYGENETKESPAQNGSLQFKKLPEAPEYAEKEEDEVELSEAEKSLMRKILRTKLCESSQEVEVLRKDKKSPLYSVKSFEQLQIPNELLKGVYAMGYNAPSRIQETTLPTLLANPPVNMIAQAQTGTGKTAAFIIASLSRVNVDEHFPQVLILAPTFELAKQIGDVAQKMAQFCKGIEFRYAVKGEMLAKNETVTEHILIGTPGKVFDWGRRYHAFDLQKIRVFVLDEADVMISTQGHQDQCIRIHRLLSADCQMLLFSATYTTEVIEFAELIIRDPIIIRLRREEETLDNVKQYYIVCKSMNEKYSALRNIYGTISIGQAIIFCRTKSTAAWLGGKMTEDGHSVGYLSGDLDVTQRLAVITRFRDGKEKVLITTNVCARGIDVEQVTVVINYDLPVLVDRETDFETYVHRIGRTGRFGKPGIAINMVSNERDSEIIKEIQNHFEKPIKEVKADDANDLEEMGC
ncbi:LOW QUALITY PROTEIN: DEAD-box helicase Dbp80-like [Stegodyphus dumicola]|uniref:LOW QUALITY PROTEIN: DEAD-box helicase Dbp80-like n=1 Tax=Stegodyphus dumicola TaxID=202533 RepID=UPI0015A89DD4|nr:LOW QUALITY PROTEIN: DEAD-box helicase Dbp80-like [Stegodyphus dumicola]